MEAVGVSIRARPSSATPLVQKQLFRKQNTNYFNLTNLMKQIIGCYPPRPEHIPQGSAIDCDNRLVLIMVRKREVLAQVDTVDS